MLYLKNLGIALDQLLNAVLRGYPDETLSSRAWRMAVKQQPYWGWTQRFIDGLFFWEDNHCEASFLSEIERKQLPVDFSGCLK